VPLFKLVGRCIQTLTPCSPDGDFPNIPPAGWWLHPHVTSCRDVAYGNVHLPARLTTSLHFQITFYDPGGNQLTCAKF